MVKLGIPWLYLRLVCKLVIIAKVYSGKAILYLDILDGDIERILYTCGNVYIGEIGRMISIKQHDNS